MYLDTFALDTAYKTSASYFKKDAQTHFTVQCENNRYVIFSPLMQYQTHIFHVLKVSK